MGHGTNEALSLAFGPEVVELDARAVRTAGGFLHSSSYFVQTGRRVTRVADFSYGMVLPAFLSAHCCWAASCLCALIRPVFSFHA